MTYFFFRLINADPMLMLNSQGRAGHEIQSSTLELINGLVSLVHQPTMPDVAMEAMEALLTLHHPDKIEMWNPESPINTFWDISSQVILELKCKWKNIGILALSEISILFRIKIFCFSQINKCFLIFLTYKKNN